MIRIFLGYLDQFLVFMQFIPDWQRILFSLNFGIIHYFVPINICFMCLIFYCIN